MEIKELSIPEKVGQMIMVGMDTNHITERIKLMITKYKIGGIILYRKNFNTYQEMLALIRQLKQLNQENKIPLWIAIDQEGGRVNRMPKEILNHLENIFIQNKMVKDVWEERYYYLPNALSITAAQAAYGQGGAWVEQLKEYLDGNFNYLKEYLNKNLPKIKFEIPEGTYLAWLDMSGTGLDEKEVKRRFIAEAGLHIEGGDMFVANGECNIRMNLACPRQTVEKALNRMYKVFGTC